MSWTELSEWWLAEVVRDSSYETVVTPLALDVLGPSANLTYLDLGSGEGRVKRAVEAEGATVVALDVNIELARHSGPNSLVARLPDIPVGADSVDGVYSVLVLEHLAGYAEFFKESARVTRPGGVLALVANHPVWTAPGSTPITDSDGEVLWRPGAYFSEGLTEVSAGLSQVTFHHRTMADLLNSATGSGWALQYMIEKPHHELMDQPGIPRLLACRWTLQA